MITLSISELEHLLTQASENGARKALEEVGYERKDQVSQNQAYKAYGEGVVKGWVRQGRITPVRRGVGRTSKKVFTRTDLDALARVDQLYRRSLK